MSLRHFLIVRLARLATYPLRRQLRRFAVDCENPEPLQTELLLGSLRRQSDTAFGRDHKFAAIRSIADYRKHVPIAPYEYVAPYIERVQRGETGALLADPRVLMFALTSGTTASRKLIPVTDEYLRLYRRGWNMWGMQMYRDNRPRYVAMRPIVQMMGDPEEFRTAAGIPCGNLSGYTAMVQKRMIRRLYSVPFVTGKIKDAHARYYIAVRFSLHRDVSQFLAANPSTLVHLARTLDAEKESLLRDLHDGTLRVDLDLAPDVRAWLTARLPRNRRVASRLGAAANKLGRLYPRDVWPVEGTVLNTWTGGSMGPYLRQLPQYYGDPPVRDLGLLASEGRFTIPLETGVSSGVLDIWSHYFEFVPEGEIDSSQPTVLCAHELAEGKCYYIVPTTVYGLYRYHISDLVRVTGFYGRTPLVEFLGKGHRFANLTGEKLSEYQVTKAFDAVAGRIGIQVAGYTLAPIWDDKQPYYGLFIEQSDAGDEPALRRFLAEFDRQLGEENIEYEAKRDSGRLGPVRAEVIPAGAWAAWDRKRLAQTGGSPEQYKHPCLIGDLKFRESMQIEREVET